MLVLLLAFSMFALTSCHGAYAVPQFEVPSEFDTTKTYEITFWAKNDSNITQVEIYNSLIRDFEQLYPNINVTLKRYTDYGKIYQDVLTNLQTGTTDTVPNVCITYPDHIATYITGENIVVPLEQLMKDRKYGLGGSELRFDAPDEYEIVEKFLTEGKVGGTQYALPFMRSTEACYVNKTYIEEMGYDIPEVMTWDFVFEVSAAAMEKNSDGTYKCNGQDTLIPFIYKSTDNMMIQMLKQKGAGYSNANGDILIFNDDTKGILYTIADATKIDSFSTFKISSYPGNFFNAGQCLFAIDSTAGATWIGPHAPLIDIPEDQLVDFEVAVYPIPQYDTENPQMISQGPSICIFNKSDPGEVLASWLFAQYLLTDKVQVAFSKTEGYIPVTATARESTEYLDYLSRAGEDNDAYYEVKIAASKLLLDNIDNTFVTPVFNGSTSLRNAAGQMIEDVVRSTKRNQTVDDAYIDELYNNMTSLYRLNESTSSGNKLEFGEIPVESLALLISLCAIWLIIGGYAVYIFVKKRKTKG